MIGNTKKVVCLIVSIILALNLIGCASQKADTKVEEIGNSSSASMESSESTKDWEAAYQEVKDHAESYVVDVYDLGLEYNGYAYIATNDFDGNGVPELIFGDGSAISIYTFDQELKKITDLYEPEDWVSINGVHLGNNTVTLESAGSDGCCYVCFTYQDRKYISGTYDEYNPDKPILNNEETSFEEFNKIFTIEELKKTPTIEWTETGTK